MPRGIYPRPTAEERFWKFVSKPRLATVCWQWLGAKTKGGYGGFQMDGRLTRATHFAYKLFYHKNIGSNFVLHKCDVPSCVNPNHLFLGTHTDNMRDAMKKGRLNTDRPFLHLKGESHKSAKLNYKFVEEIKNRYRAGDRKNSLRAIAQDYGVDQHTIRRIVNGTGWKPIQAVRDHDKGEMR